MILIRFFVLNHLYVQVIATRVGKVGAESDSDDSDSNSDVCATDADGAKFWLSLVVQKCTVATEDGPVKGTHVNAGDRYMVVRWLEIAPGAEPGTAYVLSAAEDCITGIRFRGVLPVKKRIRTIKNYAKIPGPNDTPISFKLNHNTRIKLHAIV